MSLHIPQPPSLERVEELICTAVEPSGAGALAKPLTSIFRRALTHDMLLNPNIGNPIEHHVHVLKHILLIATGAGVFNCTRLLTVGALALLHDICPTPKISQEAIAAATNEAEAVKLEQQRKRSRQYHMIEGGRMAHHILHQLVRSRDIHLPQDAIEEICAAIAIHDYPTIGVPIPSSHELAIWQREADRLWMVTDLGIRVDLSRQNLEIGNPIAFIEQAERNIGKFIGERRLYANCPSDEFQDSHTFFRSVTGYRLYCQYTADILARAAIDLDYVTND